MASFTSQPILQQVERQNKQGKGDPNAKANAENETTPLTCQTIAATCPSDRGAWVLESAQQSPRLTETYAGKFQRGDEAIRYCSGGIRRCYRRGWRRLIGLG